MKRNPRPRKYESAAARQAAYKARAEVLEFRAEPKTAASLTNIAQELDVSRSELLLSMVKFALTNHDWARFGLTHKTLPYYQGNPIMATKKASPAQLAARKKFAEMARSGAFKKAKRAADRDKNPAKKGLYSNIDAKRKRIAAGSGEKMRKPGSPGAPTNASFRAAAKTAKRNPAKKTVSQKISQLIHEGYPQKQAVAVALSEKRAGKVKSNPMGEKFVVGKYYETRFIGDQNIKVGATILNRTDKTVKVKGTDNMMKSSYRLSIDHNGNECFYPYGKYSMSPMLCADDMKAKSNPISETLIYGLPKGETRDYMEELLYAGGQLLNKTQIQQVFDAASAQGWHSFRVVGFDPTVPPNFIKTIKSGKKTTRTNPSKRSRSAVVLNPAKKRSYTVYCQVDGQSINSWTKLATFYSATKATQYAKAYAKQYPTHYVRVESHG